MHVDFLRIGKDTEVNVDVPVHFINEDNSPGIKRGGVLNIVRHDVEFLCPADAIPEFDRRSTLPAPTSAIASISRAVTLPDGVTPVIHDRDFTIATIAARSCALKPRGRRQSRRARRPKRGRRASSAEE